MARPKQPTSPTLQLTITAEQHARAVKSNSGGCLIADAIRTQYPEFSGVEVDMATIRITDKTKGLRFIYLTPAPAQHVLLSFDQGWPNPTEQLLIRKAVQIVKIRRSVKGSGSPSEIKQRREQRRTELQQKVEAGEELTSAEKKALTVASKPYKPIERPANHGPVESVDAPAHEPATVVGGRPLVQGPAHPNLLRGRNRHFGAKLADPGEAFREAVDKAVAEHLAKRAEKSA